MLDLDAVQQIVEERCFGATGSSRVGAELEWLTFPSSAVPGTGRLTFDSCDPGPAGEELQRPGALPGGSAVTFEPGGQLELSSLPHHGVAHLCAALESDVEVARRTTSLHGIDLVAIGMDPSRDPRRVVDSPRYRAMEEYFSRDGPSGKTMMCSTAALQINVDTGPEGSEGRRWKLAHSLGPTLAASFANSPLQHGKPTGLKSTRLANWWTIDASRTAPADRSGEHSRDWSSYTLDARVMLIRPAHGDYVALRAPMSFREWMRRGHELGFPTAGDLEYHMSTLFPPVRPRGRLELRYLDSLPDPWWRVAIAVASCLIEDPDASETALLATSPTAGMWWEAAACGLEHPLLAESAQRCFAAAFSVLEHDRVGTGIPQLVAEYNDRYVLKGRCPADDRLDEWLQRRNADPDAARSETVWI